MEKTIRIVPTEPGEQQAAEHPVSLRQQHLLIAARVSIPLFGDIQQVLVYFDTTQNKLLLARMDDLPFREAHKTALHMLKTRNLQGDRSIALHDVILDHSLDDTDRPLAYRIDETSQFLEVNW